MHLKPINRQAKTRRKLKILPSLSCDGGSFGYPTDEFDSRTIAAQTQPAPKKDKAAA
jgi:hypothetical protein